jgi:hypothetical protein
MLFHSRIKLNFAILYLIKLDGFIIPVHSYMKCIRSRYPMDVINVNVKLTSLNPITKNRFLY